MSDQQLAEELNKWIIKKFNKRNVQSLFIVNVWGVDLTDTHLISKFNKGIVFCYVLVIFSVNTHGLFLRKIKKELQLPIFFKKF